MILVFLAACVTRGAFGWIRLHRSPDAAQLEFPDEEQYWFIASSLDRGEGLRDDLGFVATRMPLYPFFLSLFAAHDNGVVLAKASQWIVGALAAPLVAMLGFTLVNRRSGWIASLLVAFDPFLVFFSSLLLTETFSITTLCALWLCLGRIVAASAHVSWINWLAVGLGSAFCVYLRESNLGLVLLSVIFAVGVCLWTRAAWARGALALLCVGLALFPWALRNHQGLDRWCWLTTRGGISLYDGVGPQATGASDLGDIQRSGPAATLSETQWDDYFRREAWASIRNDPARILRLAGVKLLRMWNPLPNVEAYRGGYARWVSAAWTIPLFLLAIVGAVKCMTHPGRRGGVLVLFLLMPATYFSLVHSLYVGSVRYRLPATPMLALLAASAFSKRSTGANAEYNPVHAERTN